MFNNLDFRTDVVPFVIATVGEFCALFFWLQYIDDDNLLVANLVLWAGFMVERISVALWMQFIYDRNPTAIAPPLDLGRAISLLFFFTLSEIFVWVMWVLFAQEVNQFLAAIVLFPLMQVQHSVEMAILKRTNAFLYIKDTTTLFFTMMEVLGAVGWLYFTWNGQEMLGGAILLIGLSVEHIIQGIQLKPTPST